MPKWCNSSSTRSKSATTSFSRCFGRRTTRPLSAGTQYRSVIFYENDAQRDAAEKSKSQAQAEFKDPIVTQIAPLTVFYKAEDYHQNYYNQNTGAGYCRMVIQPKLQKLLKKGLIKE
jgi:peptide-methionine (S)-S-oxide reductase